MTVPKVNAQIVESSIKHGEVDNYEMFINESKKYIFDEKDIDVKDNSQKVYLLDPTITEITYQLVFNAFNQVQFILIEAINKEAYFIYDLMSKQIMEYNLETYSEWTNWIGDPF